MRQLWRNGRFLSRPTNHRSTKRRSDCCASSNEAIIKHKHGESKIKKIDEGIEGDQSDGSSVTYLEDLEQFLLL